MAILLGIGVLMVALGWQIWTYLRHGAWVPLGALDTINWLFGGNAWTNSPRDWIGLHGILNWLHAGFAAMLPLVLIGGMIADEGM